MLAGIYYGASYGGLHHLDPAQRSGGVGLVVTCLRLRDGAQARGASIAAIDISSRDRRRAGLMLSREIENGARLQPPEYSR